MQKDQRSRDLARIHILGNQIFAGRGEYEDCLFTLASVKSAADLGHEKRQAVLAHFENIARAKGIAVKRAGAFKAGKRTAGPTGVPRNVAPDRAALMSKLDAQLAARGLTRAYVEGSMLKRIAGVDKLEFAMPDGLRKVVAAMNYAQRRSDLAQQAGVPV